MKGRGRSVDGEGRRGKAVEGQWMAREGEGRRRKVHDTRKTLPESAQRSAIEWQPRYWMKEAPARWATYLRSRGDHGEIVGRSWGDSWEIVGRFVGDSWGIRGRFVWYSGRFLGESTYSSYAGSSIMSDCFSWREICSTKKAECGRQLVSFGGNQWQ